MMKSKFVALMTAVAAAGLCGTSVWAQQGSSGSDQSSQSSQSSQPGQSGQSSQSGQSGQESTQAGQQGQGQLGQAIQQAMQKIASDPKEFVQRAYQDNLTEIQLGQLAQQKGQSQQVKQFGQHLIQGHQALNDKITQLASQKGIQLEQKLDTRHQMMVDRLQGLSGQEFDRHFVNEQVALHRRDVALYQAAATSNSDQDVKSFAQTSVPSLREHLQMAQTQASTINEAAGAQSGQGQQQQQQQQQPDQSGQQPGQQPDQGQSGQQQQSPSSDQSQQQKPETQPQQQ